MLGTILVVILILALVGGAVPLGPWTGPGYHGYGYGWTGGGMLGVVVVILLILVLLGRL